MGTYGGWRATYSYDEWGNLISISGDTALANLNPIRYRGYYYDAETGFYYLRSRYYDPEIGRFLNADALVSTGQGILGNNMFAYCGNNPVNFYDPSGKFSTNFLGKWKISTFKVRKPSLDGELVEDIVNFDEDNQSEEKVLESNYFSSYKGVLVFRVPIGKNAFSFGVMFIGDEINDITTVQHEYGHAVQYDEIGIYKYIKYVAIPSLYGYWSNVPYEEYYSQPWEYGADLYGGVVRDDYEYHNDAEEKYRIYWEKVNR